MARRRSQGEALNPWPGYVDALSTLLMVIIFVLLVFVLAQAFLSVALSGRDRALDRLNRQVAELSDMLSLERGRTGELQQSVTQLNRDLAAASQVKAGLARDLAGLQDRQIQLGAERDALKAERDRLSARLADAALQAQSAAARNEQLQARMAENAGQTDKAGQEAANLAASLAETKRQLEQAQGQLAAVNAELQKTVQADKATTDAKVADLARLTSQMQALAALRDDLERQAQDAAVRATTAEERAKAVAVELANEKKLGNSARAQVALLTQQMEGLRAQLAQVAAALDASGKAAQEKDVKIADLGARLNTALASKVQELQRYRSEFFGRLREVLAGRPGIQIVGDRFVFQSEVLFPVGSADLTPQGEDQIRKLATTLKGITAEIPGDINWLLRVDGHADRQKLGRGAFASNWELSAQRAINVVKLLVDEGVAPNRLAATGFGEFQPLDPADTPQAYAKNRRIEIRLTDR